MKENDSEKTYNLPATSSKRNILRSFLVWIRQHVPIIIFGIIFALAPFIRIWAAEISSGPYIVQFWAFAKVFQTYGLDFYRYADAQLAIFPNKGWGFVYPPIWLLILRLCLFFAPSSQVTYVAGNAIANPTWRLAMKIPIIAADLPIGLLLYWGVPGSKRRKDNLPRRMEEGKTKTEVIRCLKRYVAREVFGILHDLGIQPAVQDT